MVFKKGNSAPPTCYKKGHIPWNKGRSRSEETKKKISATKKGKTPWNKGLTAKVDSRIKSGWHESKETRRKISAANKGKRRTKEARRRISEAKKGENNPNYGKRPSEETRRKISEALKGKNNPMYGKHHSEKVKAKMRRARLKQVFPVKDTSIEAALQSELDSRGIFFVKHVSVCGVCIPDIVFPELKVAVFADGDYWHSKEFKDGSAWKKDRHQDKVLRESDWLSLRFWGSEIREDVEDCVNRIVEEMIIRDS